MLPGELRWFMSEQVHIAGRNNPLVKNLELGLSPKETSAGVLSGGKIFRGRERGDAVGPAPMVRLTKQPQRCSL